MSELIDVQLVPLDGDWLLKALTDSGREAIEHLQRHGLEATALGGGGGARGGRLSLSRRRLRLLGHLHQQSLAHSVAGKSLEIRLTHPITEAY